MGGWQPFDGGPGTPRNSRFTCRRAVYVACHLREAHPCRGDAVVVLPRPLSSVAFMHAQPIAAQIRPGELHCVSVWGTFVLQVVALHGFECFACRDLREVVWSRAPACGVCSRTVLFCEDGRRLLSMLDIGADMKWKLLLSFTRSLDPFQDVRDRLFVDKPTSGVCSFRVHLRIRLGCSSICR